MKRLFKIKENFVNSDIVEEGKYIEGKKTPLFEVLVEELVCEE